MPSKLFSHYTLIILYNTELHMKHNVPIMQQICINLTHNEKFSFKTSDKREKTLKSMLNS